MFSPQPVTATRIAFHIGTEAPRAPAGASCGVEDRSPLVMEVSMTIHARRQTAGNDSLNVVAREGLCAEVYLAAAPGAPWFELN